MGTGQFKSFWNKNLQEDGDIFEHVELSKIRFSYFLKMFENFPTRTLISKQVGSRSSLAKYRKVCPIRDYLINIIKFVKSLGGEKVTKKQFAIAGIFLLIIAHIFRRWKHMQKSLIWKGFLSESMRVEGYRELSRFKKLVFWANYPFSYARFLYDVVWYRIDRLYFIYSRARLIK